MDFDIKMMYSDFCNFLFYNRMEMEDTVGIRWDVADHEIHKVLSTVTSEVNLYTSL